MRDGADVAFSSPRSRNDCGVAKGTLQTVAVVAPDKKAREALGALSFGLFQKLDGYPGGTQIRVGQIGDNSIMKFAVAEHWAFAVLVSASDTQPGAAGSTLHRVHPHALRPPPQSRPQTRRGCAACCLRFVWRKP